jgi:hypothetical protein
MANPTADKLKQLGILHGEKAGVALLVVLCLLFLFKGITHPTIETTPDQLKKAAQAAEQNLQRPQKDQDILEKLASDNIKEAGFEKIVDARISTKQDASLFAYDNSWVSPEPGAGLLREMPTLIAVNNAYAHSGRGGLVVFERDDEGNLVVDDHPAPTVVKRKKKKRPAGPGMMRPPAQKKRKNTALAKRKAEDKKYDAAEKKLEASLVGQAKDEAKKEEEKDEKDYKEITKGYRWVVVTGTLDHKQLRENYAKALKIDFASAAPHYLRLDAERQELGSDGSWGEWAEVERDESEKVLDDCVELEDELVPQEVVLKPLVDFLPFLKSNYYRGVHVAELVPSEKRKIDRPKNAVGMGMPGMGGGSEMGAMIGGSRPGMGAGSENMMMRGSGGGSSSAGGSENMMMSGSGRPGMMSGGSGGASSGAAPPDSDFDKTEAPKVMVRMMDFTAEADKIYRYRIRIVVRNPNLGYEMVVAGTDTSLEEKEGPWSEPTGTVNVPPDVATYAMQPAETPNDPRDIVKFQVVRFHQEDGVTVVRSFDSAPGDIVGKKDFAAIPKYTGEKASVSSSPIDFTSHQIVVDATGGRELLTALNLPGPALDDPARALVMRPDGLLVLHDEARDRLNGDMIDMKASYDEMLDAIRKDKVKKRKFTDMPGYGSGSMMGGGSGMMGGR